MKLFGYQTKRQLLMAVLITSSVFFLSPLLRASETELAPKVRLLNDEVLKSENNLVAPIELNIRGGVAGISTDYYEKALVKAINKSSLFSAGKGNDAEVNANNNQGIKPYSLEVRIISVDSPKAGLSMSVIMKAVWKFYRTADEKVLLKEIITSSYTGGAFEGGFIGANRVRAAMEGASRENIRVGLEKIGELSLE